MKIKASFRPVIAGLGLLTGTSAIALAEEPVDPTKVEIAELRKQVEELTKTVKLLQKQVAARPTESPAVPPIPESPGAPAVPPIPESPEAPAVLPIPESPEAPAPEPLDSDSKAGIETSPMLRPPDYETDLADNSLPEPKRTDLSVFNPEISAVIDFISSYSASANNFNFTPRDIEVMIQSNVDQLAHAYIVFNAETELDPWTKSDPFGETTLGVEEAAIETTALPYGLALKGGEFFTDFSRLGKVHSHELPFTDRPGPLAGILGGETKARGVELSWIPPIDHYFRLTAGAVDNIGAETAVTDLFTTLDGEAADLFVGPTNRSFGDLMYYGRAATIFELGDSTTLNLGIDYARGSDSGTRQLASGDFKLTWLPSPASYDQFVISGEILHGESDGVFGPGALFPSGPTGGSSTADGAYIYAQYRIGKKWEPGIRYDWFRPEVWSQTDSNGNGIADGMARSRYTQHSLSAYLTYNLSEFNRLRLGVSRLDGNSAAFDGHDNDWLGFLQWTVVIGPHKHSFHP